MRQRLLQLSASSLLFAAIVLVNAGNYAINLLLGRVLGPAAFAEAGLLATGVLMLSFLALGFQLTAAKYGAGDNPETRSIGHRLARAATRTGVAIAVLLALGAEPLRQFLHFQSALPFYLLVPVIPLYLRTSVGRGLLQGELRFGRLAGSYLLEMVGRLLATGLLIGALIYWGGDHVSEAVALGFGVGFVAAYRPVRATFGEATGGELPAAVRRQVVAFLFVMGAYEGCQLLISHSDVILVKHYFDAETAGLYTALALIGRVVFFATWSVVTLLFPKVAQRERSGLPHTGLFNRSLAAVAGLGGSIVVACYGWSDWVVYALFGPEFASVGPLLWRYALATLLFACANVFAYYYLSLGRYLPAVLTGVAGLLQVLLVVALHESIQQLLYVQIAVMSGLFLALAILHYVPQYFGLPVFQGVRAPLLLTKE